MRLGLGKQEQENFYMAAENVTRKRLETEVQGDEDEGRTQRREVRARHTERGRQCSERLKLRAILPLLTPFVPALRRRCHPGKQECTSLKGSHVCWHIKIACLSRIGEQYLVTLH